MCACIEGATSAPACLRSPRRRRRARRPLLRFLPFTNSPPLTSLQPLLSLLSLLSPPPRSALSTAEKFGLLGLVADRNFPGTL